MKICPKCKEEKPLTEYFKRTRSKDGLAYECKECRRKHNRKRHATDSEYRIKQNARSCKNTMKRYYTDPIYRAKTIESVRKHSRKMLYNISQEQYNTLLKEQNNVCKICGKVDNAGRSLAVDHDHKTGKIRGLLCNSCNNGLGRFKDNPEILEKAVKYLKAA